MSEHKNLESAERNTREALTSNQQCATAKHEIRPAEDVLWHLREATREAEMLVRGGSIEVAVRNPNVASYMKHWEDRATKAEAKIERLRAALSMVYPYMPTRTLAQRARSQLVFEVLTGVADETTDGQ